MPSDNGEDFNPSGESVGLMEKLERLGIRMGNERKAAVSCKRRKLLLIEAQVYDGKTQSILLETGIRNIAIALQYCTNGECVNFHCEIITNEPAAPMCTWIRVAGASVMPRITTGNTMAPCFVIGERVGEILKADHTLETRLSFDRTVQRKRL